MAEDIFIGSGPEDLCRSCYYRAEAWVRSKLDAEKVRNEKKISAATWRKEMLKQMRKPFLRRYDFLTPDNWSLDILSMTTEMS